MSRIFGFFLCLIFTACQTPPVQRLPASLAEMEIDPKFEAFEGASFAEEKKIHDVLIKTSFELMERMRAESTDGVMTRDAHAKSHGCLKARFEVDHSLLPAIHRVGLFAENRSYSAWVRFSNNDHLPIRRDNEFDLRGISVKVMGVEGEKILAGKESAPTQDFLMYGSNIFFVKDNKDYVGFIRGLRDGNAVRTLITEQPKAAIKTLYAQWKVSGFTNPANMPYHSAIPIRLGSPNDENRTAIKYRAIPCSKRSFASPVDKKDDNYLRKNLKHTLSRSSACFLFQVQVQKHPVLMPVEDATVPWPEEIEGYGNLPYSPYKTVARITIPKQNFDTEERDRYCERLSFTPWHALVEHKPLGRTMRMRRDLYKATAEYRRRANNVPDTEPAGFEIK